MSSQTLLLLTVLVVAIIAVVLGWWAIRERRTRELRKRFGPEYDRTVGAVGRDAAVSNLTSRVRRVEAFEIRPVSDDLRARFEQAWRVTQERFVDDPAGAVRDADVVIGEVMSARGYPVADFEQRAADVSVDHPSVVSHYRAAHAIAVDQSVGKATTEQQRQAFVEYRALFSELLGPERQASPGPAPANQAERIPQATEVPR